MKRLLFYTLFIIVVCNKQNKARETALKIKIPSLKELALQKVDPRSIINQKESLTLEVQTILHETLLKNLTNSHINLKKIINIIDDHTEHYNPSNDLRIFWSDIAKNLSKLTGQFKLSDLSLSHLCLLSAIEQEQIKRQKLYLTADEEILFYNLPSELQNEYAQNVILSEGLWHKLWTLCKKTIF